MRLLENLINVLSFVKFNCILDENGEKEVQEVQGWLMANLGKVGGR